MDRIMVRVKSVLESLRPEVEIKALKPDDDLFNLNIIDSLGMINFIAALEDEFQLLIPNEDLIPQNLWSIQATTDTLRRLGADKQAKAKASGEEPLNKMNLEE